MGETRERCDRLGSSDGSIVELLSRDGDLTPSATRLERRGGGGEPPESLRANDDEGSLETLGSCSRLPTSALGKSLFDDEIVGEGKPSLVELSVGDLTPSATRLEHRGGGSEPPEDLRANDDEGSLETLGGCSHLPTSTSGKSLFDDRVVGEGRPSLMEASVGESERLIIRNLGGPDQSRREKDQCPFGFHREGRKRRVGPGRGSER